MAAAADSFTATASKQIAGRLDTQAVKAYLDKNWYRFEIAGSLDYHPHHGSAA